MAISILLPSLARARELAKRTAAAANLRQIAMACMMYASENAGKLPPNLSALTEGDRPMIPKGILKSPRDPTGADMSYAYVAGLTTKMARPSETIMAYENPDVVDASEGLNVAFLDGHVQWMSKDQFERKLAQTKERIEESK